MDLKKYLTILLYSGILSFKLFSLDLQVYFDELEGKIRNLNQVNNGPKCLKEYLGECDLCEDYKRMGINFIRTHDFYGPTDWDYIFPDFSKDPEDPSAYNFTDSDYYISSIHNCGQEIYYRMGISYNGNASPPPDPKKWAKIVVQILKHYNDGWNNGYQFGIKWVEIWNEPDLFIFWKGTDLQYFELYKEAAFAIKNYDSRIKVGGPALCCDMEFLLDFLSYCKKYSVPLDFLSWHYYGNSDNNYNPYYLKKYADTIRAILDLYGFFEAQNHLTEYNRAVHGEEIFDNISLIGAVWSASALIYLQDSQVDLAFRYRGDVSPFGLWWPKDNPSIVQKTFILFKELYEKNNRYKLIGLPEKSPANAIASCNEEKTSCRVVLADPSKDEKNHDITLKNLGNFPWYVMVEVLKEKGWEKVYETIFFNENFELNFKCKGPCLVDIKIKRIKSHIRPF